MWGGTVAIKASFYTKCRPDPIRLTIIEFSHSLYSKLPPGKSSFEELNIYAVDKIASQIRLNLVCNVLTTYLDKVLSS